MPHVIDILKQVVGRNKMIPNRLCYLIDKILDLETFGEQTDFLKKSGWKLQLLERNGKTELSKNLVTNDYKKTAWLSIDITHDQDFVIQDIQLVDTSYDKPVIF